MFRLSRHLQVGLDGERSGGRRSPLPSDCQPPTVLSADCVDSGTGEENAIAASVLSPLALDVSAQIFIRDVSLLAQHVAGLPSTRAGRARRCCANHTAAEARQAGMFAPEEPSSPLPSCSRKTTAARARQHPDRFFIPTLRQTQAPEQPRVPLRGQVRREASRPSAHL